jgi:hypothetical protein
MSPHGCCGCHGLVRQKERDGHPSFRTGARRRRARRDERCARYSDTKNVKRRHIPHMQGEERPRRSTHTLVRRHMRAAEQTPVCKSLKLHLRLAIELAHVRLWLNRRRAPYGGWLWQVERIRGREARSIQGGSRHYSTNLSRYRWTSNLFAEWARRGRRLLHRLNRLRMPATFCARRLRTCATSFIKPMV